MRSLARWGALPLVAWPLGSWALGLGDIQANSFLNQPLDAEIPLTATPEELASLSVALAPVSVFTEQGLDYPAVLNTLEFDVVPDGTGDYVIRVTSTRPIADPFVTMVVQLTHARGVRRQEYSVLLDPPIFVADEEAPAPITAPATREPAPEVAGGDIEREPAASAPAPQPAPAVETAPAPAAPAAPAEGGDYTVAAGDTLWSIAERSRPAGVSTNQAMISIFESNPAAFGGNINQLRRGAILRIPPAQALGGVSAAAATAEVQRQLEAWQGGAEAEPRLVLIAPSEESESAVGVAGDDNGQVEALEGEVAELQAELAATRAELEETRESLLEIQDAGLADVQNLADAPEAAADESADPAAPEADAEPAAEDDPVFVDEEAPEPAAETVAEETAEPEAESAPPVSTAPAEPSLAEQVIGTITQPLYLIIAGIAIVVLAALAFLRRRRNAVEDVTGQWEALEAEIDEEADHAATARIRAQARDPDMVVVEGHGDDATAGESAFGGTAEIEALAGDVDEAAYDSGTAGFGAFDSGTAELDALTLPGEESGRHAESMSESTLADQTLSSQTVINLDQADPIAEADFHMAYGLYDQAADLITKALASDPDKLAYKLKLLEVYFVWGNKEAFLENAQALKSELGGGANADWDKVVIMGKQICPDEPLFSGAQSSAGEVDLDLASSGESAGLDFAFDDADDESGELDLDILDADGSDDNAGGLSLAASGAHEAKVDSSSGDDMLDIGARTQAGLEAALFDDTDETGERTTPGQDIGDLDATQESPTVETSAADDDDFAGFSFDSPTVEAEGPDAPTVETPTIETAGPRAGDDGDTVEQPAPSGGTAEMTAEIELDDLGLDVGDLEDLQDDIAELPEETGRNEALPSFTTDTVEQPAAEAGDDDLLSATGVTQVLHEPDDDKEHTGTAVLGDEDATLMAPGFDPDSTNISTEVLEQPASNFDPGPPESEEDLDLNLDDFSSALEGADTVEQPIATGFTGLDLDIGDDDLVADDSPTGTEEFSPLDPQTMTEVGTKLDLARAYIDMGDPEGAKSILEEVLSEGDSGQRSEAQALIDALPA